MSDAPLSLKDFLCDDPSRPIADIIDLNPVLPAIAAQTSALSSTAVGQLTGAFKSAIDEVVNISMADVFAASWGKVSALRDAIAATRKDPTSVAIVPLLDHKLTSKHAPHIDLTYGGKSLLTVKFDIALALAVKGAILEIKQGQITGVKGGLCQGDGSLAFLGKTLLQHKSREFKLPGRLAFLPAAASAPAA